MSRIVVRQTHQRRGLTAVQMALVFPLMMAVTFAIVEYGWMLVKLHQIGHAARHAARVGARDNSDSADVTAAAREYLELVGISPGLVTVNTIPINLQSLPTGGNLSVTVSVPYDSIDLGLPLIPTPALLRSRSIMSREGP